MAIRFVNRSRYDTIGSIIDTRPSSRRTKPADDTHMSDMISGISSLSQDQITNAISTAVLKKSLDATRDQGQAVLSLLQDASQLQQKIMSTDPNKGNIIDVQA